MSDDLEIMMTPEANHPVPPPEVSHEDQFKPDASRLDGWVSSEDPNKGNGGWGGDGAINNRRNGESSADEPESDFDNQ